MLMLLLLTLIVVYLIKYNYSRLDLYLLSYKLPGPPAIPLFGNSLKFLCSTSDALSIMTPFFKDFPKPSRIWLGPHLLVVFADPVHVEKILTTTKLTQKHNIYDLIKPFLGNGLVTNSGPLWKYHRKLIQPLFNLKNVSSSLDYMKSHMGILMEKLEKHSDGEIFDVYSHVHHCMADIIFEIILGMKLNFQSGHCIEFLETIDKLYDVCYSRMIRPWIHPDVIYKLTSTYKYQSTAIKQVQSIIENAVKDSRERISKRETNNSENNFIPILDQITRIIEENPNCINEVDLLDHAMTLFLASEDTININIVFLIVLFGMNPKYQKLAAEEVDTIVGNSCESITLEDLQKFKYLDMCIKEVLRLMPIGPIILRQTTENFKIDNMVIPSGCAIVLPIITIHRNPEHWEHPEEFYPDHFLPEAVEKRHPYAYVPFSAGPRGCIGMHYAYAALRLIMIHILQRFEIEAEGTIHDIKLQADISVRSQNGYKIRLKKRKFAQ